ncbi:NHL repeat-containing protein [Brevibacillus migulae]|uniref:copper amine oxidase n=1 Tax=Brevibacillus migulae TaxID=1644114 RepID=UPI00106E9593|nr:copper amine oxidase [Brevibacillus migulae]
MRQTRKQTSQRTIWLSLFLGAILFEASPATAAFGSTIPEANPIQTNTVQSQTIAGAGTVGDKNGPAPSATFRQPMGIAVHSDGSASIADSSNQLIRKVTNNTVNTYAGLSISRDAKGFPEGTLLDGPLHQSMFQQPQGLDVDREGNLYVADAENHSIRKITPQGVVTIAGDGVQGYQDGREEKARFHSPADVAVAEDGTIYVADTLNHAIRKITPKGKVTTLNRVSERIVALSSGYVERAGDYQDGKLSEAKFNEPSGIAIDAQGNLYVSDSGNQRIRYIDLKNETVTTVAGEPTLAYPPASFYAEGALEDGEAGKAKFQFPKGIAVTAEGGLVIADSVNHAIRYLHGGTVTTLATSFDTPVDVDVDAQGNIWVVDSGANAILQLQIPEKK